VEPAPSVRATATERAYGWTKHAILHGTLEGGTLITEGEVAETVEVSRTPVREAFLRLQGEGLLTLYPKRGALVVPVTTQEIADVVGARQLLEPWAFGRAAESFHHQRLAATLERCVEQQRLRLGAGDQAGFQDADRAFHGTAVEAAGNALVATFYRSLRDRQVRMGVLAARTAPGRTETILAEHAAIADAVRRGDAEAAAARVQAHVHTTGQLLGAAATGPTADA
jgi:DNA-binding GntR family transcriptional regulator